MSSAEVPLYPGSVELQEVHHINEHGSNDITLLVKNLEINSAISMSSSYAELLISDFNNYFEKAIVLPGDIIKIQMKSLDQQVERKYKIKDVKNILDFAKGRSYVLTLVTHLEYVSFYSKLSRSYVGTTSEIATEIFKEFSLETAGIWEQSVGIQTICVPVWSPLKTLNWLAGRSRNADNSTRFLFYQDSSQAFHFTSMPNMRDYYKDNIITYRYMQNNLGEETSTGLIPNADADMKTIIELDYLNSFDIRKAINSGAIYNTQYITDITRKTFNIIENTYWDTYSGNGLNPKTLWKEEDMKPGRTDSRTVTFNSSVQPGFNERIDETSGDYVFDTSQQIEIVVFGNAVIDVGQTINIEIPSPEPEKQKDNILDQRWSGKYYIIGKRDQITFEGHKMALRLAKDTNL